MTTVEVQIRRCTSQTLFVHRTAAAKILIRRLLSGALACSASPFSLFSPHLVCCAPLGAHLGGPKAPGQKDRRTASWHPCLGSNGASLARLLGRASCAWRKKGDSSALGWVQDRERLSARPPRRQTRCSHPHDPTESRQGSSASGARLEDAIVSFLHETARRSPRARRQRSLGSSVSKQHALCGAGVTSSSVMVTLTCETRRPERRLRCGQTCGGFV
jgi:hypothetical protein